MDEMRQAAHVAARWRRQYRSREERRRIVEETLVARVSVAVVARRHEIKANQLFQWRTLYRAASLNLLEEADAG